MKLRGVLSQGLALPIKTVLPGIEIGYRGDLLLRDPPLAINGAYLDTMIYQVIDEGCDVTDQLGVTKYDSELHSAQPGVKVIAAKKEADFPALVPKTDEERVQSAPRLLAALQGQPYVITIKYDGSSMTVTYDGDDFRVCSRNMAVKYDEASPDNYWKMAIKYNLREVLKKTTYAIQGELCGPGIQKNRLGLKELDFFVFTIYDWENGRRLDASEAVVFCAANGLKMVKVEEVGDEFSYTQEALLEKAKGLYDGTNNRREGLVVRSAGSQKISFKAINNDFLLRDEA